MSKLPLQFCAQKAFSHCRAVCEGAAIMMSKKWVSAILLLQLCYTGCGFCEKVLVWPCDMSHWLNLKVILEKPMERGHEVTVLVSSQNFLIENNKPSTLNFEMFSVPQDKETAEDSLNEFLNLSVNVMPTLSPWQSAKKLQDFFLQISADLKLVCESVVYNWTILKKLQDTNYNVMIIEPMKPCGELIVEILGNPSIYTLRHSMCGMMEKHCGQIPSSPSYMPVDMAGLTYKMTFLQRVKNLLLSTFFDFWLQQHDTQLWD